MQDKLFFRYSERRCGVTILEVWNVDRRIVDSAEDSRHTRYYATQFRIRRVDFGIILFIIAILGLESKINDKLQGIYNVALKELNEFFGIHWVRNLPRLIVVSDRRTIDDMFGRKTDRWVVGWVENNNIYVLDKDKFPAESDHVRYSDEQYAMLIKHEMSHAFSLIVAKGEIRPKWLWEGVAVYTSGQNTSYSRPTVFKSFLDCFDNDGKGVYSEAGFATQLLHDTYGKQKILDMLKMSSKLKTKDEFDSAFKSVFGFNPRYEEFNILLSSGKTP